MQDLAGDLHALIKWHRRLVAVDQCVKAGVEVAAVGGLRDAGAAVQRISPPTLTLVADVVRRAGDDVSATDVAGSAGLSRGTARRYLEFLADSGTLELTLRYGAAGRPEHLYRWVAAKV